MSVLITIGRWLLVSLFLLGGVNKLMTYDAVATRMTEAGLSPASILLPMTIAFELSSSILVGIGRRLAAPAAFALAAFTLATNAFFHRFWQLDGGIAVLELSLFFKNVAIAGGLLLLGAMIAEARRAQGKPL